MINEEFDDDIPDEDGRDEIVPETVRPAGSFKRTLADRVLWFKPPIPGQFGAFKRYREVLARRFEVLSVKARKNPSLEMLNEISDLSEKIDLTTLEFFESMLINTDDVDFVAMEMIGGRVTMADVHNVMFFSDPEPEDDVAPVVKPKTPRKQTASKKAANAARTRR